MEVYLNGQLLYKDVTSILPKAKGNNFDLDTITLVFVDSTEKDIGIKSCSIEAPEDRIGIRDPIKVYLNS